MDTALRSRIRSLLSGEHGWPTLPPHDVKEMARWIEEHEVYETRLEHKHCQTRERVDAFFDSGYELLIKQKEWLDAGNMMIHRPPPVKYGADNDKADE